MSWIDQASFTPLYTFTLPSRHVLHPHACNPSMDLVVLLAQAGQAARAPVFPAWHPKGKQKAAEPGSVKTRVALWRMSGSKVWEVDVTGQVVGLAWSEDGQYLSVLAMATIARLGEGISAESTTLTCHHLSVHTGATVKKTPCSSLLRDRNLGDLQELGAGAWWSMSWRSSPHAWPRPNPGSALDLIDALPGPSKVDPIKPQNYDMMLRMNPSAVPPLDTGPHASLATFPSLLSGELAPPPDVLVISPPSASSGLALLTGAFPVPRDQSLSILHLAKLSDALSTYLNIVIRGLESAQHAHLEAEKQTMIWREDLETAAQQQAMSVEAVHADLFRMLMSGRCDVAVSEWFGGKLSGRAVAKWEVTLDASFRTIRRVITESIMPALERIILVLEELLGVARTASVGNIPVTAVEPVLNNAQDFALLLEAIRQEADHELLASLEFIKWLKYEIYRSAHQETTPESVSLMSYDVKLTWAFLKNGFVVSPLARFFPRDAPYDLHEEPSMRPTPPAIDLDETLAQAIGVLRRPGTIGRMARLDSASSPGAHEMSADSSMAMTSQSSSDPDELDLPPAAESPDSGVTIPQAEETPLRKDWAMYWADLLRDRCEKLVLAALPSSNLAVQSERPWTAISAERQIEGVPFVASCEDPELPILRIQASEQAPVTAHIADVLPHTRVLALQFFDDAELAILLETGDLTLYVATIECQDLLCAEGSEISIARSHQLDATGERVSMALNGRLGRRIGCFMQGDGKMVTVLDMDQDEQEDEATEDSVDVEHIYHAE